jgi:Lon protease-like protein
MTPDDKKKINDFLKSIGSENTVDELEAIRKRAVRTLEEWCCQDWEQKKELPQEIKDMRTVGHYSLFAAIAGMAPITEALNGLDMAVEAAYNLGKAKGKE